MAGNSSYTLEAIIKAVDKVSGPMKKIADKLAPVTRQFKDLSKAAGEFGGQMKKTLGIVAGVGTVTAAGIMKISTATADYGDNIANLSARVGWGASALQEYSYAAKFANMTSEDFHASLDTMSKRMGALQAGTGPLASKLAKISPVLQEQIKNARNNEEAFEMMIASIQSVDDINKKRNLAEIFFGNKDMIHFADLTKEQLEDLKNAANLKGLVLDESAIANSEKFNDSLDALKASLQGVMMTVGSKLLPIMTKLMEKFEGWIDANRELIGLKISEWIAKIDFNKVVEGIEGVIKGITGFIDMIGGWKNAAIGLAVVMNGPLIASFLNLGRVMLTNPIGLIITGIGLLIAAGVALYKNWDTVKVKIASIWESIKGATSRTFEFIKNILINFTPLGLIAPRWDSIKGFMSGLWENVKTILSKAFEVFKTIFLNFTPLGLIIQNWEPIKGFLSGLWENVKVGISNAFEVIKSIIVAFNPIALIAQNWEPIKNFFANLWSDITEGIANAFNFIKDTVSNIASWILEKSGVSTIMGLIDKVKGWFGDDEETTESSIAQPAIDAPSPMVTAGTANRSQAEITVRLGELPKGSTVETQQSGQGTALDVEYGYALGKGAMA